MEIENFWVKWSYKKQIFDCQIFFTNEGNKDKLVYLNEGMMGGGVVFVLQCIGNEIS